MPWSRASHDDDPEQGLPRGALPRLLRDAFLRRTGAGGSAVSRQVVAHLEAAELEIAGLHDRVAGHLTAGAYPTAAATLVPRAIARLRTAHPALEVDLREAGSPTQMCWLRAGRIELALVAVGDGLPEYDFTGLRTETIRTGRGLGVAVSADHPLAAHDEVHADDLAEQVWIVGAGKEGEPQFGAWPTLTRPTIGYKARSWQIRLGLVAAGLGVSVLPGMAADTVPRGVKWLRVQDTAFVQQRETVLVTAAERSAAASAFVQSVRDELATFAEATVPPS